MLVTPIEIQKIATLARLQITEDEAQMYAEQLSGIFLYIEQLNEVDTSMVEETTQVTGLCDVWREDIPIATNPEEISAITESFPESRAGMLQVRGVFEV